MPYRYIHAHARHAATRYALLEGSDLLRVAMLCVLTLNATRTLH